MVKCDALLLAVSICLSAISQGSGQQSELTKPSAQVNGADSAIPVHRVVLLIDPSNYLFDPLVISLHNKTLAQKVEQKRKHRLPKPRLPGDENPHPTFALPGKPSGKPPADPAETINANQLTALAELYITDALTDRLTSGYRVTVLDAKEVQEAITALRLSRQQAAAPDGAHQLCSRLECDAVVVMGMPVLTMKEGLTRDLVIRDEVRLAAMRDPNDGFTPTHKPHVLPSRNGNTRPRPPTDFTITASATAYRGFMSPGYTSNYPALAEQAAVQAAALTLHTLSTGEQAPFVSVGTKIAIAPPCGPDRADVLVLADSGRHTEIGAVRLLPTDLADFFKPDLLPVLNSDIIDATASARTMHINSVSPTSLWRDSYTPDVDAIRKLGSSLRVQYVLVAHITDVEVAMASPTGTEKTSTAPQPKPSQASDVSPWEREAHAEACGALIRVKDGEVMWTDRGDTTVTSREKVSPASRAAANRSIAIDAEKFALIDLKRHLAAFKSQFEQ